jgi:predicted nucleic acid-binding protein
MMMVYLDNNIVSSIARNDAPAESNALDQLLAAYDAGKVALVTSEVTHEEIKRYSGPMRPPVERTFRLLKKVPMVRWDELIGIQSIGDRYTMINNPMIQNDPIYDKLLALGVETVDAQHLFVAAKNGCTAFLTCDNGILARKSDITSLCGGLVVQKPSDFVASQGW